jgi:hypothetical protein
MSGPDLTLAPTPVGSLVVLGDARHRRILECVVSGRIALGEIARRCGLPRRDCLRYLKALERAGLIAVEAGDAIAVPDALLPLRRYFDQAFLVSTTSVPVERSWMAVPFQARSKKYTL